MDGLVSQPVGKGEGLHFLQEPGQQVEELIHGGVRVACGQVNDPGVAGDALNHVLRSCAGAVLPGKDVHRYA